jgi:hypothetical protein
MMMQQSLMYHNKLKDNLKISNSEREFLDKFHLFINNENIIDIAGLLDKAQYHIERNANPQFTFMDLSFQLRRLLRESN